MFSKNLYFFKKNGEFVENISGKKVDFFSCDFLEIFYVRIGCATKFHANEISFFSSYLFLIKSYSVFCQKVAKVEHTICDCNGLSQIFK